MSWLFGNGVNTARFAARLALAEQELADEKISIRLQRFAEEATREELAHINLATLAKAWQREQREVVRAFLIATKHNLFTLHFLLHCEGCHGGATLDGLHAVKSKLVCPACKHENKPTLDGTVEIAFSIGPSMSTIPFNPKPANGQYLRAIDVVNTEEFKLLFERDKPLPGEHIMVQSLTFLFTDLSGSTATYERLGDGGAYRIVREHFTLLFDIIKKHNGTIIKTIGDAVMAAFTNPADAVRASIDAKEAFIAFNKRKDIRGSASIKVGIHTGPSITPAVVHDLIIQCWDGSLVRDARACPPPPQLRLPPSPPRAAYEQQLTIEAKAQVIPVVIRHEKTIAQQLLDKAPASYVYSDGEHTIYAYKSHRSTGEWPFVPPGILYWDTTNHDLFVYPGDISPAWWEAYHRNATVETTGQLGSSLYPAALFQFTLTGIRDLDGQTLPLQFRKYFNFLFRGTLREDNLGRVIDAYYVKSPYEYLEQFKSDTPLLVDTQERLLPAPGGTFESNLSIHYKNTASAQHYMMSNIEGKQYLAAEKPAAEIVIRFNKKHIPLVIDELDSDGKLILRRTYTLHDRYTRDGVANTPIDPRIVVLPPHIIVTPDQWDDWLESQEN